MVPTKCRAHLIKCCVLGRGTAMARAHHTAAEEILGDLVVATVLSKMKLDKDMIQGHEGRRYRRWMLQVGKDLVAQTNAKGQEDCSESMDNLLQLGSSFLRDPPEAESLSGEVFQLEQLGRHSFEWPVDSYGCALARDCGFCRVGRIHAVGLVDLVVPGDARNRFRMRRLNVSVSLLFPLALQAAKRKVEMA